MWDLSSPPGIKLASPALQGRFLTIGPPGEYHTWPFKCFFSHHQSEKVQLPIFQYSNSNQAWFEKSSLVSPFYHLFYSIYLAMSGLSCSTQDPWLQCVGSSSLTRDWTWGPCIARQILNHWITRQVASLVSLSWKYSPSSSIYTMLYLYLSYDSQFFLLHIFVNMYAHVLYPFWSVSS